MKIKILFFITTIILMFGGAPKNATAQEQSTVMTYELSGHAAEKARGLKKFFQSGLNFVSFDEKSKKAQFIMKCVSDNTAMIYFPAYNKKGERTDCCAVLILSYNSTNSPGKETWSSQNMPENGQEFKRGERKKQVDIIERALSFLDPKSGRALISPLANELK